MSVVDIEDVWLEFWVAMENLMNAGNVVLEEALQKVETNS